MRRIEPSSPPPRRWGARSDCRSSPRASSLPRPARCWPRSGAISPRASTSLRPSRVSRSPGSSGPRPPRGSESPPSPPIDYLLRKVVTGTNLGGHEGCGSPRPKYPRGYTLSRSHLALAAACAATLTFAPTAFADGGGGNVTPRDSGARKFVENVSVPNIVKHQVALQQIATLNDDTREVFSPGYTESLDYVVQTLRDAGYSPKVTPFNYPVWKETKPAVLNLISPAPGKTYRPGTEADGGSPNADFITMANSPTVELTNAPVFPVGGIVDAPAGGSAAGCADADYSGVKGKVALIQRGTCRFVEKWERARAAGATGVII